MKTNARRPLLHTLSLLSAGLLCAAAPAARAALTTIDQQNTVGGITGTFRGNPTDGYGQSFRPTLLSLNAATFSLSVYAGGSPPTISLNLYAGAGYSGTLLATSAPVTVTSTTLQTTEFIFPAPVTLTPGATYTFQQIESATSSTYSADYAGNNPYANGTAYLPGTSGVFTNADFVFAEGIDAQANVPEPSTWAMLLTAGAGLLGLTLHRRRTA